MPIIADVNTEITVSCFEHGISQISGLEKEFFIKTRHMGYVIFPVFPKILAVRINHCGGVVIHADHFLFINRHHNHHVVLLRIFLHQFGGGTFRNLLHSGIPLRILTRAKVGLGENFLHAENLNPLAACFIDQRQMGLYHRFPYLFRGHRRIPLE